MAALRFLHGERFSPFPVLNLDINLLCGVRRASMAARCKAGKNNTRVVQPNPRNLMIASKIKHVFQTNNMVVVCQYSDMNTKEWGDVRYELKKNEVLVKLLPNRVTCKALEDTIYHAMSPLFLSTTCVMYAKEPKVKPLLAVIKKQPKLELLGAKVDNRLLSRQDITQYAKLPLQEELYVDLVQMLARPALRISVLLQENQRRLSSNLTHYVQQQQ